MKIGVTGIYSFAGRAYNGSSTLAQVFSQQITVREKGGSGSGDVDSSVGGEYKFELEPFGPSDFGELIDTVVKWALNIAIPIAMIIIIWSGIQMLLARGVPAKFASASKTLWYAVLGLAVIFIGKGFITLVKSILELKN